MKNSILIDKLKGFNPDADVTLTTSEDILISYISGDEKYDKSNAPIVFILGVDSCPECIHEYMNGDDKFCAFYEDLCCDDIINCENFEEFDER